MQEKRFSPLKTFLFHISLFALVFNFISFPAYAALNHNKYWEFQESYNTPYFLLDNVRKSMESVDVSEVEVVSNNNAVLELELEDESREEKSKSSKTTTSTLPLLIKEHKKKAETLNKTVLFEVRSNDEEGVIGYNSEFYADDPSDNIFSFELDKSQIRDKDVYLTYEIYGIENTSGVSKSINYGNSTGGYFIKTNTRWKVFQERISTSELKDGENQIMFTVPEGKNIRYYIRKAKLVVKSAESESLVSFVDANKLYVRNNKAYLKGTLSSSDLVLFINEERVFTDHGNFEYLTSNVEDTKELSVRIENKQGELLKSFMYPIDATISVDETVGYASPYVKQRVQLIEEDFYHLGLEDINFTIHSSNYDKADKISVQRLRNTDIAPLGTSTINITKNKQAFRFTPDGATFENPAQLVLKYDQDLLPEGYTDKDISVMYFDTSERKWKAVQTDSVQSEQQLIYAKTTHFTDYIAGVIQAPESPETTSFTPTSISDIKIADPTANIVQVQPPTANQRGDGTIDFPIVVPPGRHGLQPNLSLSYNNNGGSSFVGYGWDLSIPYITVDTKFGVPEYNPNKESESYLFNGEELMLKNGEDYYLPHRSSTMVNRVSNAVFYPKVEGAFSKIERIGTNPQNYYWVVTDKSGTKYFYGATSDARLSSSEGNIAKWMLEKVQDKHGNYIIYQYFTKTYNQGNLAGGKELLIFSIDYTLHESASNFHGNSHRVDFSYDFNTRTDKNINYRYGFKEVNGALMKGIKVWTPKDYYEEEFYELRKNQIIYYELAHTVGKFGKNLLTGVTTKHYSQLSCDCPNNPETDEQIYTHAFEYYDDTEGGLYKPEVTINTHNDFDDFRLSAIGGSIQELETTGDVDFGVGVFSPISPASNNPFSYAGTANFNLPIPNKTEIQPYITLTDIDGDGLPDKLMKIDDDFKYRKNIGGALFSQQLYDVVNFKDISSVETRTSSKINPSVSLFSSNVAWSNSKSVSESNIFMTDANADGLVDYVKDKIVYFNRIDPNTGKPTFTDDSSFTPNRIIKENDVDDSVLNTLPDLRLENDLMDVVKVWVAPKDGTINISGTISKEFVSSDDGVRFSVEHSGASNYIIEPSLLVVNSMSTNASNISVDKGDMIFFRVNSSQLPGENPIKTSWNPKVTYTTENFDSPNQYKQYSSQYSDSYIYGNNVMTQPHILKENGTYTIGWNNFTINNSTTYPELTDDVTIKLKVYRHTTNQNNPEQVLYEVEKVVKRGVYNSNLGYSTTLNLSDINEHNPGSYVFVKVDVLTTSQINWKKFDDKFKPYVIGVPDFQPYFITPQYQTYSGQHTDFYKSTFNTSTQVKINNYFDIQGCTLEANCEGNEIFLVVKDQNGRIPNATNGHLAKFRYVINIGGIVSNVKQYTSTGGTINISSNPSYINVPAGTSLYFEYYTESRYIAKRLKVYQDNNNDLLSVVGSSAPAQSDYIAGQSNTGLYKANIFYNENFKGMGTMYRNWGQFIYKGAMPGETFVPINKNYVGIDKQGGFTDDEGEVSQSEMEDQEDTFSNTDPDDLDYDFEEEEFSSEGASGPVITSNQINAIKHFAVLKPDRNIKAWLSHEKLFAAPSEIGVYFRFNEVGNLLPMNIPTPQGISPSGAVSIVRQSVSQSKGKGVTAGFGPLSIGASDTEGATRVYNDYQDVNGDGYPDIIGKKTQLTSFRGGLSNKVWNENMLFDSKSSGSGQSLGGSNNTVFYNILNSALNIEVGDSRSGSASIGGNGLQTSTRSQGTLMDINGDGLADKVVGNDTIYFNTGNGFVPSTFSGYSLVSNAVTQVGGLNVGMGSGYSSTLGEPYDANYVSGFLNNQVSASSNFDISGGFSGSRSATLVMNDFMDINGDGLIDYISGNTIYFNTGTGFVSGGNIPGKSESNVVQLGLTANLSLNILIPLAFIPIGIKFGVGGGVGFTNTYTQEVRKYMDFDGDGYLDMVYSTNENTLKVSYSNIGRTNMLKKVNNPTGSQMILDYSTTNPVTQEVIGNNYKMPFKKWVLTKVRVHDGFESDGDDVHTFAFEYFNGLKDRRERKFLGFGEVRSHQLRADGAPYRTTIKEYMLNNMQPEEQYLAGVYSDSRKYQYISNLLVKETVQDGFGRLFSTNEYEYAIYPLSTTASSTFNTSSSPSVTYEDVMRILPLVKTNTVTQRHYQGTSTTDFMEEENASLFNEYDKYGNVTRYRDNRENLDVEIAYHYVVDGGFYIVNTPKRHAVKQGSTVLRLSETELSPAFNFNVSKIHRIKTLENAGQTATTDLFYDNIGNLIKVIFPKPTPSSSESERFYYEYEYDDNHYKQYVNTVRDAYGYESKTLYNNYGLPYIQKDPNENVLIYTYDSMRRLKEFKGPYNELWTIRNEYKVAQNGLRYAVTTHNITDEIGLGGNVPENNYQLLRTATFADGLGRIIQTKKQLDVYQECENADEENGYRFAVSGKVVYDEFGRTVESYLGQEELSCTGDFMQALESYIPLQHVDHEKTSNFYDTKDRVLQNHVHGLNATTEFEYGFGNDGVSGSNKYFEKVILPEGNVTKTFKDYKGRTTATHQIGDGETLQTTFSYDSLSQLTQVTDADQKVTSYEYDSFGNKSEVNHPDNGISKFEYDLTGKLQRSRNQNLINQGQSIAYKYHYNQLQEIAYPSHLVRYEYGVGNTPNDRGRLVYIGDLTGSRTFKYGDLGEVVDETRVLMTQDGDFQFNQTYRYDSWGRMMEQTYPDGEKLIYSYNSVGQLKSITDDDSQNPQVYLEDVKYNFFDQPTEVLYGNGVKTTNEYDITQRIRAMQLDRPDETTFMRNVYSYDANQNISKVANNYSQHDVLRMGGAYTKNFYYDSFNRLHKADIGWAGYQENHTYHLDMSYNNTHGIETKDQYHARNGGHTLNSYKADYLYENNDHPHAPSKIKYTMNDGGNGQLDFNYDPNGNMVNLRAEGAAIQIYNTDNRQMLWDEQNRLMAVIDQGSQVSHYIYDHAGERTFKATGSINEINIGGQNIYQVLDINKYTMYPSGNMVVNVDRQEATKHYYINEKRFASRIVPIDDWIQPDEAPPQAMAINSVSESQNQSNQALALIVENTDIESEDDISYTTMSIGNSDSDCTAQLQTILQIYGSDINKQHCWTVISHMAGTMSPCDALEAANAYVCIDIDPATGEVIGEVINNPGETPTDTPLDPQTMDCTTMLNNLIASYSTAQAAWEEAQFGAMTIGLFSNVSIFSVGACCPVNELCEQEYWETIEQLRYIMCQTTDPTTMACEGLPADMDIPEEVEDLFYANRACFEEYFSRDGGYNQGLEPDCYPMDCEDEHQWDCEVITGGETQNPDYPDYTDDGPFVTIYPDSCFGEALEYINTTLLEDQSNACEVYAYVLENYDCLDEWEEEEPGTPVIIGDPWVDNGGDNDPPVDGPYNEAQRQPIWWYHSDHLGSSSYITDNFGRPSHYYEYLPFGELLTEHNQSKYYKEPYPTQNMDSYDNAYKFNGKELDSETGMYYYGARYYDPRMSIFVSVDPLAEQTMTPYQYVNNNPVNLIDPTGMMAEGVDGGEDHWQLNSEGKLEMIKKTNDDFNVFFDSDGNKLFQTNETADTPYKQASEEYRLKEYTNDMISIFIQIAKNEEVYDVMQDRAQETGFDDSLMSLASMKKAGEIYIKNAPAEAVLNFIPTAMQWVSGYGYVRAIPDGIQDVYDVGKNIYRGNYGTDFELDIEEIWNRGVNKTKQSLKDLKHEFNKGLNQLRNMPVNMR